MVIRLGSHVVVHLVPERLQYLGGFGGGGARGRAAGDGSERHDGKADDVGGCVGDFSPIVIGAVFFVGIVVIRLGSHVVVHLVPERLQYLGGFGGGGARGRAAGDGSERHDGKADDVGGCVGDFSPIVIGAVFFVGIVVIRLGSHVVILLVPELLHYHGGFGGGWARGGAAGGGSERHDGEADDVGGYVGDFSPLTCREIGHGNSIVCGAAIHQ